MCVNSKCLWTRLNGDAFRVYILKFAGEEAIQDVLKELSGREGLEAPEATVVHNNSVLVERQLQALVILDA